MPGRACLRDPLRSGTGWSGVDSLEMAAAIRRLSLELCFRHRASHVGSSLSVADILAVLFAQVARIEPAKFEDRDRVFFSKGHASAAYYAAISQMGLIDEGELLENFGVEGSQFTTHISHKVPGVELSTGSLGHALGVALGSAMVTSHRGVRTYVILSDGELDEGSNWEAILLAAQLKIANLTLVIDANSIQSFGRTSEVIDLEPLPEKFTSFRWNCVEVDGHSHAELARAFEEAKNSKVPTCLVARTTKGRGVSFMEDKLEWHYRTPSVEEYKKALAEIDMS